MKQRHQHKRILFPPLVETPRHPTTKRRALRPGEKNRRIIALVVSNGVEYSLHATKGYRAMRA